jgi:hypothetical protein
LLSDLYDLLKYFLLIEITARRPKGRALQSFFGPNFAPISFFFTLTGIIARGPQGRSDTWVEPAFREIVRENGTFFRGAKCGENGKKKFVSRSEVRRKIALCCWRKMAKMALSKRNLSEINLRKTALLNEEQAFPKVTRH